MVFHQKQHREDQFTLSVFVEIRWKRTKYTSPDFSIVMQNCMLSLFLNIDVIKGSFKRM